ncbi:SAF domain-containing protein [Paenibacillus algorifonticola]|uniref:SAF domain-containing protein n=1 Tax=Paenibacillus algorifonticola TaxID=684063 RepID=UPI003D2CC560
MKWRMEFKKLNRIFLYVLCMLGSLSLMYMLDIKWSKDVDTSWVVMASRQIMPREQITVDDLALVKMKNNLLVEGATNRSELFVGKEALQLIEAGDQLTLNRVDKMALLRSPDAQIVEVPDEWLLSVPGSLRRLDRVTLTAVYGDQAAVDSETGQTVKRENIEVLTGVVVAYYKDSGASEVESSEQNKNPNIRVDATVRGRKLELELTPAQLAELSRKASEGYQFIVGYTS